jgi:hypothetical protein
MQLTEENDSGEILTHWGSVQQGCALLSAAADLPPPSLDIDFTMHVTSGLKASDLIKPWRR